jgi:phosphoribosylformimino-5-aminoimidazole carboxamide ribotide isomerase
MDGQVVHARRGDRSRYRPLCSTLCDSSAPLQVVDGLMHLHSFATVYIADIDAILGRGHNRRHVEAIADRHPNLVLWLDSGARTESDLAWLMSRSALHPVIGTESTSDIRLIERHEINADTYGVLSLDFHGDAFLGSPEILANPAIWPRRIIVMMLARVGSGLGPDLDRLRRMMLLAPAREWYVGGGVRDSADLYALAQAGVRGALVATALHTGVLDRSILNSL